MFRNVIIRKCVQGGYTVLHCSQVVIPTLGTRKNVTGDCFDQSFHSNNVLLQHVGYMQGNLLSCDQAIRKVNITGIFWIVSAMKNIHHSIYHFWGGQIDNKLDSNQFGSKSY